MVVTGNSLPSGINEKKVSILNLKIESKKFALMLAIKPVQH